jgi:3-oxoadipate enol-lactonase
MPSITVGDLEIHHEIHGSGPPLLNIGGSGGDLRTSFPERNPLNRHFTVLHYDQRGLGRTSRPEPPYSMDDYAADAAGLIRAVGWKRCHVVGTSFGGMVAQHLAIRHGELIDRLVLNCTSPGGSAPSFPLHTLEALDIEARIELLLGLYDCRWDPGRDDPIPGLGPFYDQMIERMRAPRTGDSLRGYLAQIDARSRHDALGRLHRVTQPTLVCAGAHDDLAPVANSELMVERLPDAELRIFDGGHFFLLQDRTAFPAIIDFLQQR